MWSERPFAGGPNPNPPKWGACAVAPILAKLAKHLALLATVLITGGGLMVALVYYLIYRHRLEN